MHKIFQSCSAPPASIELRLAEPGPGNATSPICSDPVRKGQSGKSESMSLLATAERHRQTLNRLSLSFWARIMLHELLLGLFRMQIALFTQLLDRAAGSVSKDVSTPSAAEARLFFRGRHCRE